MIRGLGVRSKLLLAVVAIVTLAIILLVGGFNVILARRMSADATGAARARAEAEVNAVIVRNGKIAAVEAPDAAVVGSQVWIFDAHGKALEAPRAGGELQRAAAALAGGRRRTLESGRLKARLYAVPVVSSGRRLGTVVAAVSTAPYRETRRTALIGSLVLALALLTSITLIARFILRAALRPVTEMTALAAAWSERDLGRRFARGTPHDELTELAATLDALLDRLSASLRREQRFAAELSHELRTPLARISGEAELALDRERRTDEYREAFQSVSRDAQQMSRTVDALVAAARQEAGLSRSTSDARDAITHASEAAQPLAESSGVEIAVAVPRAPVRVAAEVELIERILQPLLENACQYGRSRVDIGSTARGTTAVITISDDGPGVADDGAAGDLRARSARRGRGPRGRRVGARSRARIPARAERRRHHFCTDGRAWRPLPGRAAARLSARPTPTRAAP